HRSYRCADPRLRRSFPTRRSSDLAPGWTPTPCSAPCWNVRAEGNLRKTLRLGKGGAVAGMQTRDAEGRAFARSGRQEADATAQRDRKSTRLNSSHVKISYAVFCLK